MKNHCNIKQAEQLTGIPSQNIRFYEKEGLIHPTRSRLNSYRQYSEADIRTLKLIRMLRMLDMPLEDIRQVLQGTLSLPDAAGAQQARLEARARQLEQAIRFCRTLKNENQPIHALDVDEKLAQMGRAPAGFAGRWLEDYRQIARYEHEKQFVFYPDGPVTTPAEFSAALFAYADQEKLNLVITKESMYPEFTIDGVEYTAERNYTVMQRVPVACIRCTLKHPEQFAPDLPLWRKRLAKAIHFGTLPLLGFLLLVLQFGDVLRENLGDPAVWVILLGLGAMAVANAVRGYLFHYNENGKTNRK